MRNIYQTCTIQNVVWGERYREITALSFEVVDDKGEIHPISIQNGNAPEQLSQLRAGTRNRAIFAFGMADIDIWRQPDGYRIEWSPTEACFLNFMVSAEEMEKLFSTLFVEFLKDIAPYVVVVGSFGRNEETEASDIDCYLRSRPVDEADPEADNETYMPEILQLLGRYCFEWSSVITGHVAVERQLGVPRMVEISSHYCIPYTASVFHRGIYGVDFLCAADSKDCSVEDCCDQPVWDDEAGNNVIRHPLPKYRKG